MPLAIGVYPGAPMVDSEEELRRKVEEELAPGLLRGLTGEAPTELDKESEPEPGSIVMSGDYDEVQEYFHKQMWTDGMPVTPPTCARVDAFLKFTDRKESDVIRVLPQEGREGSILSIAITGVMAGCRPEYMPVLIAIVEAILDPAFVLEDAGATPGWEPLVKIGRAHV